MPGLLAGIHVLKHKQISKTWMAGTSPAMTKWGIVAGRAMRPATDVRRLFGGLFRTDPEDHARPWNLHQRRVGRSHEFGLRAAPAKVSHRAVVGNPRAAVGSESELRRPIPSARAIDERLVARLVLGKPLHLQRERVALLAEVDDLDLMADFVTGGVGRREAEVPFEGVERRPRPDRPAYKRVGYEVDAGE